MNRLRLFRAVYLVSGTIAVIAVVLLGYAIIAESWSLAGAVALVGFVSGMYAWLYREKWLALGAILE